MGGKRWPPVDYQITRQVTKNMEKLNIMDPASCYSVSDLNQKIKAFIEGGDFTSLWLKGEVSNFVSQSVSGHWYFTLKDPHSQIRAVMFRSDNQKMEFLPQAGMELKVHGNISVYKRRGEYQLICDQVIKAGRGDLSLEFERIKKRLEGEGLFDRKRPLPFLPKHILIITSPEGAAIQDILNILKRRHKGLKVTIIPSLVQGAEAPEHLCKALNSALKLHEKADVLIIARGGGSIEDLWCFNNEELAKAVFHFPLPVISAVGHERDFTICDFVADLRAATPSEAAERVVGEAGELFEHTLYLSQSLNNYILNLLKTMKEKFHIISKGLIHPAQKIRDSGQTLDEITVAMSTQLLQTLTLKKEKLNSAVSLLTSLNPFKVLDRGYVFVTKDRTLIKDIGHIAIGDKLKLQFANGHVITQVENIKPRKPV